MQEAIDYVISFILKNKIYTECEDKEKEEILTQLEILKRGIYG